MASLNAPGPEPTISLHQDPLFSKPVEKQSAAKICELMPAERSLVDTARSIAKFAIKIAFPPVTLLVYLIVKSLERIVAPYAFGTDDQTKIISQISRDTLKSKGGEEIQFGLKRGPVLEGMYFHADPQTENQNPKTVLVCTGSHQSYEYYAEPMVRELRSMGCNVMVFNYEGFGKSEGDKSEDGVYRSVEAAYQYLVQEKSCSDESIVAWGYSLGSGAVTDLSTRHTVDIVIDRGFSSMSQMAYQSVPKNFKTLANVIFMAVAHFDNLNKISKAKGNVFIAQGSYDGNMPSETHGKLLQSKSPSAIYREVNSGHHHGSDVWFSSGEDREKIKSF